MVTSNVENINEVRRKITITIPSEQVDSAIAKTVESLASTIRVPGFRKGKVPAKLVKARIGKDDIVGETINSNLTQWMHLALDGKDVMLIGRPDVNIVTLEEGKDGEIIVEGDVKPDFELPNYKDVTVEGPEWEVTQEEVDTQVDQLRERFATLEAVERPIESGDLLTITIVGMLDGEKVDDASAEDMMYEVPEEGTTESVLDKEVIGKQAGDELTFVDTLGEEFGDLEGKEVDFTATIKDHKIRVLPELDDDLALTASEFDTIDELIENIREEISENKIKAAHANQRAFVIADLTEKVDIVLPESLVDDEYGVQMNRIAQQADQLGIPLEEFISIATSGAAGDLMERIRTEAEATVKARLVVEKVADAEEIEIGEEDLQDELAHQASHLGREPGELAQHLLQNDLLTQFIEDIRRRKAIDILVENATITNPPPEIEETISNIDVEEVAQAVADAAEQLEDDEEKAE